METTSKEEKIVTITTEEITFALKHYMDGGNATNFIKGFLDRIYNGKDSDGNKPFTTDNFTQKLKEHGPDEHECTPFQFLQKVLGYFFKGKKWEYNVFPISEFSLEYESVKKALWLSDDSLEVNIEYGFKKCPPADADLELKTENGVFRLSGKDADFCKHLLLAEFDKAIQFCPPQLDPKRLLFAAFNHPSVPLHSEIVEKRIIPVVIDVLFNGWNAKSGKSSLDAFLQTKSKSPVGINYQQRYHNILKDDEYSQITKLLWILGLLMDPECKKFNPQCKEPARPDSIEVRTLHKRIREFMSALGRNAGCEAAMKKLIEQIYYDINKLNPENPLLPETLELPVKEMGARLGTTTLKELLPAQDEALMMRHVISEQLSNVYHLKNCNVLNWKIKQVKDRDKNTFRQELAVFLQKVVVSGPSLDFIILQNVKRFKSIAGNYFSPDFWNTWGMVQLKNSVILVNRKNWSIQAEPGNHGLEYTQACFFEHNESHHKQAILSVDFSKDKTPNAYELLRSYVENCESIQNQPQFAEYNFCVVGQFPCPIPVQGATGVDPRIVAEFDHPKEACFEIENTVNLIAGQSLDTLKPGQIVKRPLFGFQEMTQLPTWVQTPFPELYSVILMDQERKQYCTIPFAEFIARLEQRTGLRLADHASLEISKYGLMQVSIVAQNKSMEDKLQSCGAFISKGKTVICLFKLFSLCREHGHWTKVKQKDFLDSVFFIHFSKKQDRDFLYLPNRLVYQLLTDIQTILSDSYLVKKKLDLQVLAKEIATYGMPLAWPKIMQRSKERLKAAKSFVASMFDSPCKDTQLLCSAIVHIQENLTKFPDISNLVELMVAEQIRQLMQACEKQLDRLNKYQPDPLPLKDQIVKIETWQDIGDSVTTLDAVASVQPHASHYAGDAFKQLSDFFEKRGIKTPVTHTEFYAFTNGKVQQSGVESPFAIYEAMQASKIFGNSGDYEDFLETVRKLVTPSVVFGKLIVEQQNITPDRVSVHIPDQFDNADTSAEFSDGRGSCSM